jgi:CRP-like cAMP-binding protein
MDQAAELITVPIQLFRDLLSEVQRLRQEMTRLSERFAVLEAQKSQENPRLVEKEPADEILALNAKLEAIQEETALERAYDRQRLAKLEASPPLQSKCENDPPSRLGKKTLARTTKLKEILKKRGASQSFQQLQKDLGISPSAFTRLLGYLDKRIFEVARKAGSRRGEKILKLRERF